MVTNAHRRLSGLSLKTAFDEQRSLFSRGFQKIFVKQPKYIDNDNDDTSSFSSEELITPSLSLTPSTSSYSVPSSLDDCDVDLALWLGVVFIWLHIQLQIAILLLPTSQSQPLPLKKTTTAFDPKALLPSRLPGPVMPHIDDLVLRHAGVKTAALWNEQQPPLLRPSRRQNYVKKDKNYDDHKSRQAVQNLVQDVLAYLEEFSGDVVPELEALRPQLESYAAL
ncbi:hypothetical protein BJV82DRAFT_666378 [Fennellomyces sp. T-0311]|nr:hypothetical protein BJV82DRAFT_666378 [Fennellomyces sp. T-0311]